MRLITAVVLACALACATAYPNLHLGCKHPDRADGQHKAPTPDATIAFTITDATGTAVTSFCPGEAYEIQLAFAEARNAMLTTSLGAFTSTGGSQQSIVANCQNQRTNFMGPEPTWTTTVSIPACATSSNDTMELQVTSAAGITAAFKTSSLVMQAGASCACSAAADTPAVTAGNTTAVPKANTTAVSAGNTTATNATSTPSTPSRTNTTSSPVPVATSPATSNTSSTTSPAPAARSAAGAAPFAGSLAVTVVAVLCALLAM